VFIILDCPLVEFTLSYTSSLDAVSSDVSSDFSFLLDDFRKQTRYFDVDILVRRRFLSGIKFEMLLLVDANLLLSFFDGIC